jgi:parallel beta-helix repeat protein
MKNHLKISSAFILAILLAAFIIACGGGGDMVEEITYYEDADGDGYGNRIYHIKDTSQPEGYVTDNTDCNDNDSSVNPGADEIPDDGIDNDCDMLFAKTYYADADGDGYGDPDVPQVATSQPVGYVTDNTDCDDTDDSINPVAEEACDSIDNNCDGKINDSVLTTYYEDNDGDEYGNPGVSQDDCSQPSGYVTDNSDCNDSDASINPGAVEFPDDGKDNNCDGLYLNSYYEDLDGDGYGNPGIIIIDTYQPEGYILEGGDCDDTDASINPGVEEIPDDGIDNDCNGLVDPFYVPDDFSTIQEAIDAVPDGAGIQVRDGTYVENINFNGKAVTVKSDNGAESTIIDGNASGSVVTFSSLEGLDSVLDGFTITNGSAGHGGGIYCYSSSPTITNCTISDNTNYGIYCYENSSPTITNCTISDNINYGIYCYENSSPTITNCTFSGNIRFGISCDFYSSPLITDCTFSGDGISCVHFSSPTITNCTINGGGIKCRFNSSPTITNSTISNNSTGLGAGGIECYKHSSPTITNCIISNNSVDNGVGGILCSDNSSATITNCTISNNSSNIGYGGGIKCYDNSSATITNSTISNNTEGSGILCRLNSSATITNSTISNNSNIVGAGGIWCQDSSSFVVVNTILWGNVTGLGAYEIGVDKTSSIDITYSDIQRGWEGEGNINADPLFVDDTNEDIILRNYHLTADSPCIDAGTSVGAPADDIDGDTRDSNPDIGSDEYTE